MALVACPDCGKSVSDQAPVCPYCGLPVAVHFQRVQQQEAARKAEEERLLAEAEAQRRKDRQTTVLVIIGVIAFFLVLGGITNSHPQTSVLFELNNQTAGATPGINVFSASGKVSMAYSCRSNGKALVSNIQITLVDMKMQSSVWKKSLSCPVSGSGTLQVKASTYDVAVSMHGDPIWTLKITQP